MYRLVPHPDDQRVFAVWRDENGTRAYKWQTGLFTPTAEDERLYDLLRRKSSFQVPDLALQPLYFHPDLREMPQWVRKAALIAGIRKGYAVSFQTGYWYIPDRLRVIVYPTSGKPLYLHSFDEDILVRLTWAQVRQRVENGMVYATDLPRCINPESRVDVGFWLPLNWSAFNSNEPTRMRHQELVWSSRF